VKGTWAPQPAQVTAPVRLPSSFGRRAGRPRQWFRRARQHRRARRRCRRSRRVRSWRCGPGTRRGHVCFPALAGCRLARGPLFAGSWVSRAAFGLDVTPLGVAAAHCFLDSSAPSSVRCWVNRSSASGMAAPGWPRYGRCLIWPPPAAAVRAVRRFRSRACGWA